MIDNLFADTVVNRHHEKFFTTPSIKESDGFYISTARLLLR
jgi:hypothetical protein